MQIETYIHYSAATNEIISAVSFKAFTKRTETLARSWMLTIAELSGLDLSFVDEPLDTISSDNLLDAMEIAMQGTGRQIIWSETEIR